MDNIFDKNTAERNSRKEYCDNENTLPVISAFKAEQSLQLGRCSSPEDRQSYNDKKALSGLSCAVQYRTMKRKNTLLLAALQGDDVEQVAVLLQANASPNATCRDSLLTACHVASLSDSDALALLLKAGADGQRRDRFGRTPLHLAAWAGRPRQIALLLNSPQDLQCRVEDMTSETEEELKSLRRVNKERINLQCEPMEEDLLPDMRDITERNCKALEYLPLFQRGWTALHAACASARPRCARLLLAAGAVACAHDATGRTPLDVVGCFYYSDQNINVDDFSEVIRLILIAGGEVTVVRTEDVNGYDSPLHTAVALGSLEAIKKLLDAGARVDCLNKAGQTPMHLCVKKQLKEHLELLVNYEYRYACADSKAAAVLKDIMCTVLHAAIIDGWLPGVCVALDAGASVTIQDYEKESPIHAAARLGDVGILQAIITNAREAFNIDFCNIGEKTALFIAIENNNTDCIPVLLTNGASITHVLPDNMNVLHVAAKHGNVEALSLFLNQDGGATMINSVTKYEGYTPICFAALNNHAACVKLLLSKRAAARPTDSITTPLHIAALKNHCEIAKMIIEFDKDTIHKRNGEGLLPLHVASLNDNRDIIVLLLRHGADLSSYTHRKGPKAIDLIMSNISKPAEFLEEIFDSYITCDSVNVHDKNCAVKIDYSILMANADDTQQMKVIKCLVQTGNRHGQSRLLLHPLIESFLYIKWMALVPFFYLLLFLFTCFVISLNVYVVSVFYYKDKEKHLPSVLDPNIWKFIVFGTCTLAIVQEIIYMRLKHRRYLLSFETWVRAGAICLSSFLPLVVRWESPSNPEWARLIATVALLLSWIEMMFVLSRFPNWGFYVVMFGKVSIKVVKILLTFGFLLVGFALSFMIQFRSQPPFEGPFAAFVTTLVMMASEFEYTHNFTRSNAKNLAASIIILRLIFVACLILSSIVLMNLMVGVAVNDLNNLEVIGNIRRLEKQVEFLTSLEAVACHKMFSKILPKSWNKYIVVEDIRKIELRMWESKRTYMRSIPKHIREAIFTKVQQQKKEMDEQLRTVTMRNRLEQMYNAILRKDDTNSVGDVKLLQDMVMQMSKKMDNIESNIDSLLLMYRTRRTNGFKHTRSSGILF